jgi:hypothetical protein
MPYADKEKRLEYSKNYRMNNLNKFKLYDKKRRDKKDPKRESQMKQAWSKHWYSKKYISEKSNAKMKWRKFLDSAKRRNIISELTQEKYTEIIKLRCYLCGDEPAYLHGVDRVDNDLHYTEDNSKPCCKMCNYMKRDSDLESFLWQCKKIVAKWDP